MSNLHHRKKYLSAGRFIKAHSGQIFSQVLVQLLVRVIALAPLGLVLAGVEVPFFSSYAALACGLLSAALYLLLVMPLRYKAFTMVAEKGFGYAALKGAYGIYLKASLRRVGAGLLWGLPFIAAAGLWIYAFNGMEMPTFFNILTALGGIVGGRFDAGIMLWIGGIVVFGLVFAFGWWYGMPKDYVPMDRGVAHAFKMAGRLRRRNRGKYWGNAVVNVILTVPTFVIVTAILGVHYVGSINLSMGAMVAAQQIMSLLSAALPASTLAYLAAALLLVHVPLCVVRKVRNAVLTCKLYKQEEEKA